MVVLPIGGADMPVVISLLNALTGLSAAATGLALDNTAMIVAGMIVGASGTILTNLMAKAMNRSIPAIVAGGFGGTSEAAGPAGGPVDQTVRQTSAADAALQMGYASQWSSSPDCPQRACSKKRVALDESSQLLAGHHHRCGGALGAPVPCIGGGLEKGLGHQ